MKNRLGAIVWIVDGDNIFLRLEKRGRLSRYPSDAYVTFLTGDNFSDLVLHDHKQEEIMRQYARDNGIRLTTNKILTKLWA